MKFAVVVVVLFALAFGVQSSIIPLVGPLSYTAVHGPSLAYSQVISPAAIALNAAPIQLVAAAPAPAPAPAPVQVVVAAAAAPVEGTYVAQNRGAVHVAALPGHANSASSVNLEPAPGTL